MRLQFDVPSGPVRDPVEQARSAYRERWEAVEAAKAQELAALTEERARTIILSIEAAEAWRERRDWSGLVEQQAIFHRTRSG